MTTQRTKTVKGVAVYDAIGYLCGVETYGYEGYWCEKASAAHAANEDRNAQRVPADKRILVPCTITFTLPNRTKKGKP